MGNFKFNYRVKCGWLCPVGGLQEICTVSVNKRAKGGKRNWIKYIIWVPWIKQLL
ncbi:MAG: 4Fe-4S binding protein [Firmicutes bacterium]|nr:4Fe-4S binding protein [Bacillota bacterium]